MTKFNNEFVPVAPKTYEVRYVENKEISNLSRFASYLGIKMVENCSSCSNNNNKKFELVMNLRNMTGSHLGGRVYSVNQAKEEAKDILEGKGHWKGSWSLGAFSQGNRQNLVNKINDAIAFHTSGDGNPVIKAVYNS